MKAVFFAAVKKISAKALDDLIEKHLEHCGFSAQRNQ